MFCVGRAADVTFDNVDLRSALLAVSLGDLPRVGQGISPDSSAKASDELPNRGADLVWRVLLNKVDAGNGDFPLVRPASAEVADTPDDLGTRIGIDEKLWELLVPSEPFAVAFDDLDYIGRSALYRQLARPYKCWEARFPISKRRPVSRHFLTAQLPDDALGQNHLDEEILVEHHVFALL